MLRLRSRLRFSLSTLFVLVAGFAVGLGYVGYQWRIVQERNKAFAILDRIRDHRDFESTDLEFLSLVRHGGYPIPWIRRLLGENRNEAFEICYPMTKEERDCLERAFPEAIMTVLPPEPKPNS